LSKEASLKGVHIRRLLLTRTMATQNGNIHQDTLTTMLKAGYKLSELENDLLFKAIVKVLVEKRQIKTPRSGIRGAKTTAWRNSRKTAARTIRSRLKTPSPRRNGRNNRDLRVEFSFPG